MERNVREIMMQSINSFQRLHLMREMGFAKQKSEGEIFKPHTRRWELNAECVFFRIITFYTLCVLTFRALGYKI